MNAQKAQKIVVQSKTGKLNRFQLKSKVLHAVVSAAYEGKETVNVSTRGASIKTILAVIKQLEDQRYKVTPHDDMLQVNFSAGDYYV